MGSTDMGLNTFTTKCPAITSRVIDLHRTLRNYSTCGHHFTLASPVDAHHGQVHFSWELKANGADPLVSGVFDVVGANGRLEAVTRFLDHVPAVV
jgi:hypothetical protein